MSCSESVTKVVEKYVESMKESSADKVREAFHPNAKVELGLMVSGVYTTSYSMLKKNSLVIE